MAQEEIIEILEKSEGLCMKEIAELLNLNIATVCRALNKLYKFGEVEKVKLNENKDPRVFHIVWKIAYEKK